MKRIQNSIRTYLVTEQFIAPMKYINQKLIKQGSHIYHEFDIEYTTFGFDDVDLEAEDKFHHLASRDCNQQRIDNVRHYCHDEQEPYSITSKQSFGFNDVQEFEHDGNPSRKCHLTVGPMKKAQAAKFRLCFNENIRVDADGKAIQTRYSARADESGSVVRLVRAAKNAAPKH